MNICSYLRMELIGSFVGLLIGRLHCNIIAQRVAFSLENAPYVSVWKSGTVHHLQQRIWQKELWGQGIHFAVGVLQTGQVKEANWQAHKTSFTLQFLLLHPTPSICYVWSLFSLFLLEGYTLTVFCLRIMWYEERDLDR